MGPCSKLAKHTVKLSFAATREEKDKRSKRTLVEIGSMSSGGGEEGDECGEVETSNPPRTHRNLSEMRKAGVRTSSSTGVLRLEDSRQT